MFRCQLCRHVVAAGVAAQRLVVQTRTKKYPFRAKANRIVQLSDKGKRKVIWVDDPGGAGQEIVKELLVCPDCASRHNGD